MNHRQFLVLFMGVLAVGNLALLGCSKSSSTTAAASSEFSSTYPEGFAVSSPTSASSASFSLSSGPQTYSANPDDSFAEKKQALDAVINGDEASDCAISVNLVASANANCYGPTLAYVNHPNASAKDANSTDDDGGFTDNDGDGSLPGGDLGIWEATEPGGEACAAAQLTSRFKGVAALVDAGLFSMAGLMCAAKVSGQVKPVVGASIDLTSQMADKVTINGQAISVSAASIARSTDTNNGEAVYISTVTGTSGTKTYSIRLKHIATSTDNATFTGKLSISIADADGTKPGNCGSSSASGQTDAVSILYEKSSSTSMKYEVRSANFCGSSSDPYVSSTNKTVDFDKKFANPALPTGWGNNANYFAASFDPASMVGSFAYAWQAGVNDGNTRVLLTKVDSSGASATAWFGFGPAADDSSVGTIDRMICNWAGAGSTHTGVSKAQQQVMTLSSGKFVSSSASIVYDPTNTCTSDGTDGAGNAFSYSWTFNGASQNRVGNSSPSDLVDLSAVTSGFTAPSVPAEID